MIGRDLGGAMTTFFVIAAVFVVAGLAVLVVVLTGGRHAKRALKNAPAILDETFSGPVATYKVNMESLPFEVVMQEAVRRGYKLAGQQHHTAHATTYVFERI